MKQIYPSDTTWRDAIRYSCGKGYFKEIRTNRYVATIRNGNERVRLGVYDTAEKASDVVCEYREDTLISRLEREGLHPDQGTVYLDKYIVFEGDRVFNLHGREIEPEAFDRTALAAIKTGRARLIVEDKMPVEKPSVLETPRTVPQDSQYTFLDMNKDTSFTKDQLINRLPKVGERLKKRSCIETTMVPRKDNKLHDCVVTFINPEKLWYQVEFENEGFKWKESFKLPEKTPKYV